MSTMKHNFFRTQLDTKLAPFQKRREAALAGLSDILGHEVDYSEANDLASIADDDLEAALSKVGALVRGAPAPMVRAARACLWLLFDASDTFEATMGCSCERREEWTSVLGLKS